MCRVVFFIIASFLFCLSTSVVRAGSTCYQWAIGSPWTSPYSITADDAVAALVDHCNSSDANKSGCYGAGCSASGTSENCVFSRSSVAIVYSSFPTVSNQSYLAIHYGTGCTAGSSCTAYHDATTIATVSVRTSPEGCPQCPAAGAYHTIAHASPLTVGTTGCGTDGCQYSVVSPSTWMLMQGNVNPYVTGTKSTGAACGSNSSISSFASDGDSDTQQSSDSKTTGSLDPSAKCGIFNGDMVCPTSMQSGQCVTYPSGGVACVASTSGGSISTPPAPNNGSSTSTPATPSAAVNVGNVTSYYYNSTVVSGSTVPPTTTGQGSNSGGVNYGSSSSGSSGSTSSGTASGGETCEAQPVCSGDQIECAQLYQVWTLRCGYSDFTKTDLGVGDVTTAVLDQGDVDVSTGFDTTGFFGSRECIQDQVIDLGEFGQHTVPWSQFCSIFQWLGAAIVVVGILQGVVIIGGKAS